MSKAMCSAFRDLLASGYQVRSYGLDSTLHCIGSVYIATDAPADSAEGAGTPCQPPTSGLEAVRCGVARARCAPF
eukprot:scaffold647_cov411-Prasinococcus_capsulatus_cf.AAC.1